MRIGLDLCHGVPYDGGAVGFAKEEDIVNPVGYELQKMFEANGDTVILLRPPTASSVEDSLNRRCYLANNSNLDLIISIHANKGGGTRHEVFCIFGGKSEQYAKKVYSALDEISKSERGVKTKNLAILKNTKAPAILVELLFLDTKDDIDLYNSVGYKKYATAIFKGVTGKEPKTNPKYYIVTKYLVEDQDGYINMESIIPLFKDVRFYLRHDEKGVWIETQYLTLSECTKLKKDIGSLFHSIK